METYKQASRYSYILLLTVMPFAAGCEKTGQSAPNKEPPPAEVAHEVHEDQLNTVELTSTAAKRIGLQTAAVEQRDVPRRRSYGGEVVLPTGASIVVSAPLTGELQGPPSGDVPGVGVKISQNQTLYRLVPLLSPERDVLTPTQRVAYAQARMQLAQAQIDTAGQVKQAQAQVDAAKITLQRAQRLLNDMVGTAKTVDDAKAQLEIAQKALDAAQERKVLLDEIKLDAEAGKVEPLPIASPRTGIVRSEFAVPGELVPAGSPLFEVMNPDPIWIKVPVYVGEAADVDMKAPSQVKSLSDPVDSTGVAAKPVSAPPTAVPQAAAVDLYYQLPNPDLKFRPGERVNVTLTLQSSAESLVVPWPAIVHDINGGTWLYEQTAPLTFVRRRVQIAYVTDEWAVLKQGPPAGAQVVTQGVAELFGAEFGVSH